MKTASLLGGFWAYVKLGRNDNIPEKKAMHNIFPMKDILARSSLASLENSDPEPPSVIGNLVDNIRECQHKSPHRTAYLRLSIRVELFFKSFWEELCL
jgi:hypothetical protein